MAIFFFIAIPCNVGVSCSRYIPCDWGISYDFDIPCNKAAGRRPENKIGRAGSLKRLAI